MTASISGAHGRLSKTRLIGALAVMARVILAAAALAFAGLAVAAPAQAALVDSTFLVSRTTGFGPLTVGFTNDSWTGIAAGSLGEAAGRRLASFDGRFVVFVSDSDGLSADDLDSVSNVYVRDNLTATTTLVSRGPGVLGAAADGNSGEPSISGDGQWVAFQSRATNLSEADEGGTVHVFKRNLVTGQVLLVDRADGAAGVIANELSVEPSISEDGTAVAFSSSATNLSPSNGPRQVYVRDGANTELVSAVNGGSTPGNENSRDPSISADGSRVAFTSDDELVSPADANTASDVYLRQLGTSNTALISRQTDPGQVGNGDSHSPSIASDDHPSDDWRVAFVSEASNLAGADSSSDPDIFVRIGGGTITEFVSRADGGGGAEADADSTQASISDRGTRIAFTTASTNLASIDTNGDLDVYVRTLADGPAPQNSTVLGSRGVGNAVGDSPSLGASMSPDGNRVHFDSLADNFHPDDDNDFLQVYRRSLLASLVEPTVWISRPTGTGAFRSGTNDSTSRGFGRSAKGVKSVSADGRFVAFASNADELSSEDDDRFMNVFVRDTLTGQTTLVSRASGSGPAANASSGPQAFAGLDTEGGPPAISADGRRVAFTTAASNLAPDDNNGKLDVFVRDLVTGETQLASRAEDGSVKPASSAANVLSADGTRVAFASAAQLVAADNTSFADVYMRDLVAGTTTLVSRQTGAGGDEGNQSSFDPAISADGTRVAFATDATNLAPPLVDGNGFRDVYLRDLTANATVPISVRNQPLLQTGNRSSAAPAISADGMRVAFDSFSSNLVASGDVNGIAGDVFVRDLAAATTTLVSRGPNGLGGNQASQRPSISADGNRVAFESFATDFSPLATGGSAVFLRDLAAGSTQLVSRADGAAGGGANRSAANAAISANGNCVAFDSRADSLVPGGPPGTDFIRTYMRVVSGECPNDPPETATDSGPAGSTTDASRSVSVDTTRPGVSRLRVMPRRFGVPGRRRARGAAAGARAAQRRGAVISFALSEPARVTLTIERAAPGRRARRRCVPAQPRLRSRPRCVRWVRMGGLPALSGQAGDNRVRFSGRIGRRALRPGPYRVVAAAVDDVGNRSRPRSAKFRVIRRG